MTVTIEYINSINFTDIPKMSLGERWKIAVQIAMRGIGVRVGKRFFKSSAYISMIAAAERSHDDIEDYLDRLTTAIIQTYKENNNICESELLKVEENIKISVLTD